MYIGAARAWKELALRSGIINIDDGADGSI